jgi:hypothetical protein
MKNGTRSACGKPIPLPGPYRVNFEVTNLKPFPYLTFPQMTQPKRAPKQMGFDGELMASFISPKQIARKHYVASAQGIWQLYRQGHWWATRWDSSSPPARLPTRGKLILLVNWAGGINKKQFAPIRIWFIIP